MDAEPYALACGFILEEGLALSDFERILESMQRTCAEANARAEKGILGGCVINVPAIGRRTTALENNLKIIKQYLGDFATRWALNSNLNIGDKIILSGTVREHGLAVLSAQQGLAFGSEIMSDVKPLNCLVRRLLVEVGGVVAMKDPARGGLADALNEFSEKSRVDILIHEDKVPIREDVRAACEMLGLDLLEIGNEGKTIIGTVAGKAEQVLKFLKETNEGKNAEIIGEITKEFSGAAMQTTVGGKRIIARPVGDPVPRIC